MEKSRYFKAKEAYHFKKYKTVIEETEKLFKECLKIDETDLYARLELGNIYAIHGKDDKSKKEH